LDEEPPPLASRLRGALAPLVAVGGQAAEQDLGEQPVAAGPAAVHPRARGVDGAGKTGTGGLLDGALDRPVGGQGVQVEPRGVRVHAETLGDLGDLERAAGVAQGVQNLLSPGTFARHAVPPPPCPRPTRPAAAAARSDDVFTNNTVLIVEVRGPRAARPAPPGGVQAVSRPKSMGPPTCGRIPGEKAWLPLGPWTSGDRRATGSGTPG